MHIDSILLVIVEVNRIVMVLPGCILNIHVACRSRINLSDVSITRIYI